MNWLDAVLVIFLIFTTLVGVIRGLVGMLLPLIGLVVGVIVAGNYYTGLANDVFRSDATAARIAAFIVIVLVFLIIATLLTVLLHGFLKRFLLDWLNHLLGAFAGFVIGSLIAGAILSILLKQSVGVPTIQDSAVASFLVDKFPFALSLLPGEFDKIKNYFH